MIFNKFLISLKKYIIDYLNLPFYLFRKICYSLFTIIKKKFFNRKIIVRGKYLCLKLVIHVNGKY